jgi:hypothetical protein
MPLFGRGVQVAGVAHVQSPEAGSVVVVAGVDGGVEFWDIGRREPEQTAAAPLVAQFEPGAPPVCMLALPDGLVAMAGDANGFLCVWNAATGAALRELVPKQEPVAGPAEVTTGSSSGRSKAVQQLSLAPDGRLAAVSADGSVRLWDWRAGTYTLVRGSDPAAGSAVQAGTVLSDGRLLVGAASGRLSELSRQSDGSYVCTRTVDLPGCAWRLWQLADGIIAAVDVRQQLSVTLLWPGDLSGAMPLDVRGIGAGGERYGVAVTPEGALVAVTEAGRVEVWSAADLISALIPPTVATAVPALLGRVSDSDASEASQESSGSEPP